MSNITATILKSAICKTKLFPRPCPTLFYFPGLNSAPFYKSDSFETVTSILQQNYNSILYEYTQMSTGIESDYKLLNDEHKLHDGQWNWDSYLLKGERQLSFAKKYPITTAVLDSLPLMTDIPFGYAFFSTLKPFSSIGLHSGPMNLRIRCHFPLVVPNFPVESLGMAVGDQKVTWTPGVPIYFDDCYEHKVWNKTPENRVVLLFDMWHPDIKDEEKKAIKDMFGFANEQGWLKK